jgi:hypothetical protein
MVKAQVFQVYRIPFRKAFLEDQEPKITTNKHLLKINL